MNNEIILKASNIVKEYRDGAVVTKVLHGVNLEVKSNELIVIIGSSGSGKSTLLHILGTLDSPTSGEILFKGENLLKLGGKKLAQFRNKNLGFVYQFHHLLTDFTALENVCMPMLISGAKKQDAITEGLRLLDRVGLAHRINHKPSELSGGERQRVAIARAIINRPSLILADEPTGNLDRKSAEDVFNLLTQLRAETACSLVVVTHDKDLATRFERCLTMHDGRLEL